MADFVMPILGADMEDGTLVEWRKQVGDAVHRGDVVAEVETEKGLIEVEAFVDGVLESIAVQPGTKVAVGTVLAVIREAGEAAREARAAEEPATAAAAAPVAPRAPGAPTPTAAPPAAPPAGAAPVPRAAAPVSAREGVRASPAARRRAAELGVELAGVAGSGPDGAIQIADVERAAAGGAPPAAAAAPPAGAADGAPDRAAAEAAAAAPPARRGGAAPGQRMRQTIAAAMARSKREIPHYYLATTIDLQAAMEWTSRRNAERKIADRILPGALLIKAVACALREVPALNAVWRGDHAEVLAGIHVGVAVSLRGGGLVAPAIHDVDRMSLDDVMRRLKDLVNRTRAGTLRSSELSDGTITVTSLGDQGTESVFGVIYPPQVAIVGFGRIAERPWVVEGQVVACPVVTATLAADHRVTDGHVGARFLTAVERLLQKPEDL